MKILITGATGFIGKHLLQQLIEKGHFCRCLVRRSTDLDNLFYHPNVELFQGDVTKAETLKNIGNGIDVVYHLAAAGHVASVSEEDLKVFFELNVQGTKNIITACGQNGVKRFIHFSSTAAIGLIRKPVIDESVPCNPQTPYQRSKYESELSALEEGKKNGMGVVVLRPCMVYGSGGKGEFLKICRLIKKGIFPRVGLGKNLTPIVHVQDVVQAAVKALQARKSGEVYLIASEFSPPLADLHNYITESLNIKRIYFYVPFWVAYLIACLLEKKAAINEKTPIVSRKNIISITTGRTFDISRAKKELRYNPSIRLAKGIKETVGWYRRNNLI